MMKGYIQLEFISPPSYACGSPVSLAMLSTIGQVRVAEAEEEQDTLEEAEDRLQTQVPVLGPLFRGPREAEAVVHRVRAEALQCLVRLVRREAEAVLRQR